jgi:predicted GIY-YIG superfamily endonuclease
LFFKAYLITSMHKVLYVLALEDACFYVGVTINLERRIKEHAAGKGGAWTRRHKYTRVVSAEPVSCDSGVAEDAKVIALMCEHGIYNVRGGTFSGVDLGTDEETVHRMIWHAQDRCLTCGSDEHWAAECTEDDDDEEEDDEEY